VKLISLNRILPLHSDVNEANAALAEDARLIQALRSAGRLRNGHVSPREIACASLLQHPWHITDLAAARWAEWPRLIR